MTRLRTLAIPFFAALLGATSVARAEPQAGSSAIVAPGETPGEAWSDDSTDSTTDRDGGTSVPGVVLMIVGGTAVGVGASLAIIDAARGDPQTYERGLDPGVGGARGRAGQLPLDDSSAMGAAGAVLLGAGALVHIIGVVLVFGGSGGDDDDEASPKPVRASVEPVLGAGYGGFQGSF